MTTLNRNVRFLNTNLPECKEKGHDFYGRMGLCMRSGCKFNTWTSGLYNEIDIDGDGGESKNIKIRADRTHIFKKVNSLFKKLDKQEETIRKRVHKLVEPLRKAGGVSFSMCTEKKCMAKIPLEMGFCIHKYMLTGKCNVDYYNHVTNTFILAQKGESLPEEHNLEIFTEEQYSQYKYLMYKISKMNRCFVRLHLLLSSLICKDLVRKGVTESPVIIDTGFLTFVFSLQIFNWNWRNDENYKPRSFDWKLLTSYDNTTPVRKLDL